MAFPESLEVAGSRLRRWDAHRDLPLIDLIAGDADVRRFIPLPADEAGRAAVSARFADHWETYGFGLWAVRGAGGRGAGWVGACHPLWHPEYEQQVELAWSFTASLRGRGIATTAARTAAAACFDALGLDEVIAFVDPANEPSLAVTRRLGMRLTGSTQHPGTGAELHTFTLARADLPAAA